MAGAQEVEGHDSARPARDGAACGLIAPAKGSSSPVRRSVAVNTKLTLPARRAPPHGRAEQDLRYGPARVRIEAPCARHRRSFGPRLPGWFTSYSELLHGIPVCPLVVGPAGHHPHRPGPGRRQRDRHRAGRPQPAAAPAEEGHHLGHRRRHRRALGDDARRGLAAEDPRPDAGRRPGPAVDRLQAARRRRRRRGARPGGHHLLGRDEDHRDRRRADGRGQRAGRRRRRARLDGPGGHRPAGQRADRGVRQQGGAASWWSASPSSSSSAPPCWPSPPPR